MVLFLDLASSWVDPPYPTYQFLVGSQLSIRVRLGFWDVPTWSEISL